MSNNIFSDDFQTFDEYSKMKKHSTDKTTKTPRVSDEASAYIGLVVLEFLFVTVPLALLLAGLAVVPFTGAVFGTDLGFWTAFFVLATLRWLIPRPRKRILFKGGQ